MKSLTVLRDRHRLGEEETILPLKGGDLASRELGKVFRSLVGRAVLIALGA